MKLTKLHLFLMLLLVLILSSLGIGVLEGYGIIEGNENISDSTKSLSNASTSHTSKSTYKPDVRVEFKKLGNEKRPMGYGSASGITKNAISPGEEHLYVLKSEMVPPVCPKCPEMKGNCGEKKECPPCPAPQRCPVSAFKCKKVPNYSASNVDNVLPSPLFHQGEGVMPVLNSFAKFS